MPNKELYEYAVIRFVPQVEREEFVNIGVIVLSKKLQFLDMKYQLDKNRLSVFKSEMKCEEIERYIKAWERICQGEKGSGLIGTLDMHERFRWLTASRSTVIQSSPVHPGLTDNPKKILEELFIRFVL